MCSACHSSADHTGVSSILAKSQESENTKLFTTVGGGGGGQTINS
jgi:hypothetical protein